MKRVARSRGGTWVGVAVALVAVLSTACTGGDTPTVPTTGGPTFAEATARPTGRLTVLGPGPQQSWDPQRMLLGSEQQFASRVFLRTLTTYSAGPQPTLIPDLATDLGTMTENGRKWTFTLVESATWQDGKPVTCEDVKYGISRTFAQEVMTGGPSYLLAFLDIPTTKDAAGLDVPAYNGPYKKQGQELFDRAVTCTGRDLTLLFKAPWTDFNVAAALPAYAPVRADQDRAQAGNFAVFSNGPYQLSGTFDPNAGGTFVRNPYWNATTDPVRKALPDSIVLTLGVDADTVYRRLMAGDGADAWAVPIVSAPPAVLTQLQAKTEFVGRLKATSSPYVDYLVPNYKSPVFSTEKARLALALSTNRDAYVAALGGATVMAPTVAMCHPHLACHREESPLGVPSAGDPVRAKAMLAEAGLVLPVPIRVVYRQRGAMDAAMNALKTTWAEAGFDVTLEPVASGSYYSTIQAASAAGKDVFWASWGAEWPSGSTVIGALFDGRINITAAGSGSDYGYFNDDSINARIDQTYLMPDRGAREQAWGDLDVAIATQGGHIALANHRFTFLIGSRVTNGETNPLMGGYVDLAQIGLE